MSITKVSPNWACQMGPIHFIKFLLYGTRSSSCLTLSRPPVTSHLMFSNRAISITAPRLWNDLPPDPRTISSPPPPSLPITRHHLHPPPLSVTPCRAFHSKLKSHLFKHSYPDPSDHCPFPSQQHPS